MSIDRYNDRKRLARSGGTMTNDSLLPVVKTTGYTTFPLRGSLSANHYQLTGTRGIRETRETMGISSLKMAKVLFRTYCCESILPVVETTDCTTQSLRDFRYRDIRENL